MKFQWRCGRVWERICDRHDVGLYAEDLLVGEHPRRWGKDYGEKVPGRSVGLYIQERNSMVSCWVKSKRRRIKN